MDRKETFQGDELVRKRVHFGIPDTGVGRVVVQLPLAWAWVQNHFQPVICCPGLRYPDCELATAREIETMMGGAQ